VKLANTDAAATTITATSAMKIDPAFDMRHIAPANVPARRSAPHCSRRLRTFSITVSYPARKAAASA
jgi:hypothetical protein